MKKLRSAFISILFLLLTFRTTRWLKRVFSALTSLELEELATLEVGRLRAAGATVDFEPFDGRRFLMSEIDAGTICVREEEFLLGEFDPYRENTIVTDTGSIVFREVFRNGKSIRGVKWAWKLKQLHKFLRNHNAYITAARSQQRRLRNS